MATRGRPRANAIDEAITAAIVDLVGERGLGSVTIEDVVTRAATNKPAFYRRYASLIDAVSAILVERHGIDHDVDTGSLASDLYDIQRREVLVFSDPFVLGSVGPGFERLRNAPEAARPFTERYLTPRRRHLHAVVERAVRRGEVVPDADPDWVADVLTGPLIMRALLPMIPPIDDALVRRTVENALDSIGYTGDRSILTVD